MQHKKNELMGLATELLGTLVYTAVILLVTVMIVRS